MDGSFTERSGRAERENSGREKWDEITFSAPALRDPEFSRSSDCMC